MAVDIRLLTPACAQSIRELGIEADTREAAIAEHQAYIAKGFPGVYDSFGMTGGVGLAWLTEQNEILAGLEAQFAEVNKAIALLWNDDRCRLDYKPTVNIAKKPARQPVERINPPVADVVTNKQPVFTKPYPNKFKEFSNMTYSASIYIQSPAHYRKMINNGVKEVDGLTLLMQSGGINNGDDFYGAIRSTRFKNDFYFDNIQLKSFISGKATGAAHNTFELNFNVIEPMGLTFLENLNNAIRDYNEQLGITAGDINFVGQTFLMVIRFYGYDKNGLPVTGSDLESASDNRAAMEKFIPFMFTGITFRLESDKVVYACTALCPQTQIGTDKVHGAIPKSTTLTGQTIKDLFAGGVNSKGLVGVLNDKQQALRRKSSYTYADTYKIEFRSDRIANATVASPGTTAWGRLGESIDPARESALLSHEDNCKIDTSTRSYAIPGGTSIMQAIDLAIRTSSYITDQYTYQVDANDKTGKNKIWKQTNSGPLYWFKIHTKLDIGAYDPKRRDFAYNITFIVKEYPINTAENVPGMSAELVFPIQKEYDFWFTGKNTEVLNFAQDFNFLYYTAFGSTHVEDPTTSTGTAINRRLMAPPVYSVNGPSETLHGGDNKANSQGANIARNLYSPSDQANVTVDIVGDPDWIAQSEIFYDSGDPKNYGTLPDGSLNYDAAEIFFSMNFNTVVDYDLSTGLADVTQKNVVGDDHPGGVSQYSLVYRANIITTQLASGKFTQRLEGTIKFMPGESTVTKKETAREDNKPAKAADNSARVNSDQRTNSANAPITLPNTISKSAISDRTAAEHKKTTEQKITDFTSGKGLGL